MYQICLHDAHLNKTAVLKWSRDIKERLKAVCYPQQGPSLWRGVDLSNDRAFFRHLEKVINLRWSLCQRFVNHRNALDTASVYLEIGPGISIYSLLLSQFYPHIKFYLVDRSYVEPDWNLEYFNDRYHGFYNDFSIVKDCIATSGLDPDRFVFLDPDDAWPNDIDIVSSFFSYCWHYGLDHYWERIQSNLKKQGLLVLDVLDLSQARDRIQEQFDSPVDVHDYSDLGQHIISKESKFSIKGVPLTGRYGSRLVWVRP